MASSDPLQAASSAEIFSGSHTLPQIRTINKDLHAQVEEKASRLRTQVGNSYRELLGTADTIVQMRLDNDRVQELLGHLGSRCGRDVVGNKVTGWKHFATCEGAKDKILSSKARLRLLEKCTLTAGRVLRGGGGLDKALSVGDRLLTATRVLVLGRLLVKTLEEAPSLDQRMRPTLEQSKKSLAELRRRLTTGIERRLNAINEEPPTSDLLKMLCAHSLVSISGAKDMLQYFLRIRGQAIAEVFEMDENSRQRTTEDVVNALKLYTRTLLDVQSLVPNRLAQALGMLKEQPLLEDETLQGLEGLQLNLYERWCGDDVRHYAPYIRHDDLDVKYARDALHRWAEKGARMLLKGLGETLSQMADFASIADLRTRVLQLWIRDGARARGFDPSEMQQDLREVINERLLSVLDGKVKKLRLVGSEIKATLENWRPGVTDKHQGLWEENGYDAASSEGAPVFVQEVMSRLYGQTEAVSRAVTGYHSWYEVINDVKGLVEQLQKQRWDNDYDEIEDEETIETRLQVLSQEDPEALRNRLDEALDQAFRDLDQDLRGLHEASPERKTDPSMSKYLLRVLRAIRKKLPDRAAIKPFGIDLAASLQDAVSQHVVAPAVIDFAKAGLLETTVPGRPLWEGEPPLPTQVSPCVFQLLRKLSLAMADEGPDLWTPACVALLKKHFIAQLTDNWRQVIHRSQGVDPETSDKATDGEDDAHADEDQAEGDDVKAKHTAEGDVQDLHTQWVFDLTVLEICMGSCGKSEALTELKEAVSRETELDEAGMKRISKSSQEFWQRTRLLFGLLA